MNRTKNIQNLRRANKFLCAILCLGLSQTVMAGRAPAPGPGSLDTTFDTDGKVIVDMGSPFDHALAVGVQPDNKIVAAGQNKLTRRNPDGSLDSTFGSGGIVTLAMDTGSYYGAQALIISDGKILVAGGGASRVVLARYTSEGILDPTFGTNGTVTTTAGIENSSAYAIAIQPDGKIVLAGEARNWQKYPCDSRELCDTDDDLIVLRYTANGILDSQFGDNGVVTTPTGTRYNGDIGARAVAIQSDGKIVVGGYITGVSNFNDLMLARYDTRGVLDPNFGSNGIVVTDYADGSNDDMVNAVTILPDARIVVGGTVYPSNANTTDFALLRYLSNGSLDPTFGNGGKVNTDFGNGFDYGMDMAVQADGKYVVAGSIDRFICDRKGVCTRSDRDLGVVRYQPNGTLDTTFGTSGKVITDISGLKVEDTGQAVVIQADGKIVVSGSVITSPAVYDWAILRYLP